ncbi:MAG: small-conductance mechanosensitive channel [Candidatus Frackibacter sp. T328-2]|nr:MAG: small-conductance mechanosensitive channel [Candidatus Frackibacter sp. T328-2]
MELTDLYQKLIEMLTKVVAPNNLILIGVAILQLVGIIILGNLLKRLTYMLIDQVFKENDRLVKSRRARTLNPLLKSVTRYIVYFIGATMALEVLGIPTTSILAGAGIAGLAFGFGARSLVEDVITGFFILFEDQFSIGDYIETAGVSGIVEEVSLRITKIKNFDGDVHIVPNGEIKQVTNFTAADSRIVVDIGIGYDEDIARVIEILKNYSKELAEEMQDIKKGPEVVGVEELGDSSVTLRTLAWVTPMEKWAVERKLRQRFKEKLDAEDIEIPYPKRVLITESKECDVDEI